MLWLTLPSTYSQESSFYVNSPGINTPKSDFIPSDTQVETVCRISPLGFSTETFTYAQQRNHCSFQPVLFTLRPTNSRGPLAGTEQRSARQASLGGWKDPQLLPDTAGHPQIRPTQEITRGNSQNCTPLL